MKKRKRNGRNFCRIPSFADDGKNKVKQDVFEEKAAAALLSGAFSLKAGIEKGEKHENS